MSLAICWKACVRSLMMISRIGFSLSVCPNFKQIRLQTFEVGAKRFLTALDILGRTISIFREKSQASSAVKRNQSLDNMVPIDDRFVVGSNELIDSLCPQFRGIVEFVDPESCYPLKF